MATKILLGAPEAFILRQTLEGELARLNIDSRKDGWNEQQMKNIEDNREIVRSILMQVAFPTYE